jgi:hypothetical protein
MIRTASGSMRAAAPSLLPAVLIGDVRNFPFRQHRWLLQGLLWQQPANEVGLVLSGEKE